MSYQFLPLSKYLLRRRHDLSHNMGDYCHKTDVHTGVVSFSMNILYLVDGLIIY